MKILFLIAAFGLIFGVIKQAKSVKDISEVTKVYCKDVCHQK